MANIKHYIKKFFLNDHVILGAFGLLGMSFINSVFVDAMVEDNNDEVKYKLDHIERKLEEIDKKLNKNS